MSRRSGRWCITPHILSDAHNSGRYLTAIDRAYHDSLSSASQKSLALQGGPFQGEELAKFEADPLKDEMVAMRLWDDAAKVVGVEASTPRASSYLDILVEHLAQQTRATE